MNLSAAFRFLLGKIPAWLPVLLALGGFWYLSRGMLLGGGNLTAYAEEQHHNVGPLQSGWLKSVSVQLGQEVKAGDVIAQLESKPLELQRERLQAELAQAKAMLLAQEDTQSSQLQRSQLQAVRAHAVEERSRAELRELNQQLKRLNALKAQQLVRASDVEAAQRRQRAMAAELAARPAGTPRELELMGLRPRPLTDQNDRLEERLGPYRAAVTVSESALREIEYAIAELTLRAPVDGTVGAILQRAGDVLTAGAPVVTLVTARPGTLVAYAQERQMGTLVPGSTVNLRRPGLFTPLLRGRVIELAPLIEEFPLRARPSPAAPMWGRRIVIQLEKPMPLIPGETFRVGTR